MITLPMGLAILQVIVIGVFRFGDVGFDKPGRYGLAFEHAIALAVIYLVSLAFGAYLAYTRRDLYAGILQLCLLLGYLPFAYYKSVHEPVAPASEEHQDDK